MSREMIMSRPRLANSTSIQAFRTFNPAERHHPDPHARGGRGNHYWWTCTECPARWPRSGQSERLDPESLNFVGWSRRHQSYQVKVDRNLSAMDDFRFVDWEPVGEQSHYQVPGLGMSLTGALYEETNDMDRDLLTTLENCLEEQLVSTVGQGRRGLPPDPLPRDSRRQVRMLVVVDDKDYLDQREQYDVLRWRGVILWNSKAQKPDVPDLGSWRQRLLDGFEGVACLDPECLVQFHREPGHGGAPPPRTSKFLESPYQVHV